LDARFTKIKQIEEQKDHHNLVLHTLSVAPENNSPSIMLYNGLKVTLKLCFHTPNHEGPWSGSIPLHAVELVNGNQNSWLVKSMCLLKKTHELINENNIFLTVPMKDNMKKYRSIWCRLIIENINKIPRMLVRYKIIFYFMLLNNSLLHFNISRFY
jgi:hypothetical protein